MTVAAGNVGSGSKCVRSTTLFANFTDVLVVFSTAGALTCCAVSNDGNTATKNTFRLRSNLNLTIWLDLPRDDYLLKVEQGVESWLVKDLKMITTTLNLNLNPRSY